MQIVRNIKLNRDEHLAICPSCNAVLLYHTHERTIHDGRNDYYITIVCKSCHKEMAV